VAVPPIVLDVGRQRSCRSFSTFFTDDSPRRRGARAPRGISDADVADAL
jgi:hypothetical protein